MSRDYKEASKHFVYDENSPSCIVWKEDSGWTGRYFKSPKGTQAGSRNKQRGVFNGWVARVLGENYLIHRIIWCIFHGEIDEKLTIDHIDGDPLNNKIDNLRLVTQTENNRNHGKQSNNKTGKTGVVYMILKNIPTYAAIWSENGMKKSKRFSVKRYGVTKAFELACEYRDQMIKILNSNDELSKYTERHGKD